MDFHMEMISLVFMSRAAFAPVHTFCLVFIAISADVVITFKCINYIFCMCFGFVV